MTNVKSICTFVYFNVFVSSGNHITNENKILSLKKIVPFLVKMIAEKTVLGYLKVWAQGI